MFLIKIITLPFEPPRQKKTKKVEIRTHYKKWAIF